jgi:sigma-B regulation protein RsbU (phosphoserine phosphatase)
MQQGEQRRVELANAKYFEVAQLTDRTSFAIFLLSGVAAAIIAYLLAHSLSKRLDQLKLGAQKVGEGDLAHRIPDTKRDELGRLASSFNVMALSLQNARDELERRNKDLEESQKRLAAELAEAAAYVRSLLPPPALVPIGADWRYVPSMQLGGDAFGYHWLDREHMAIYLLDVCGHGVGSALLGVSAMNVLRSNALPGTDFKDPGAVLGGLNDVFQMEGQNDAYFTIWYGVYHAPSKRLRYASGGHPPAVLVTNTNGGDPAVMRLDKRGLVIGAIPGIEYAYAETRLEGPARLYVFSDGIYEIMKRDGEMLTYDEFVQILMRRESAGDGILDTILEEVRRIKGEDAFEDDVSLVELRFE